MKDQVILSWPLFFIILLLGCGLGWAGHSEFLFQRAEWREAHKGRCAYSDVRGEPFVTCDQPPSHWLYR